LAEIEQLLAENRRLYEKDSPRCEIIRKKSSEILSLFNLSLFALKDTCENGNMIYRQKKIEFDEKKNVFYRSDESLANIMPAEIESKLKITQMAKTLRHL